VLVQGNPCLGLPIFLKTEDDIMKYNDFNGSRAGWLGLGAMRLPTLEGQDVAMDWAASKAVIDYCYENGITYFDTAYAYNKTENEAVLGDALHGRPRESFYLATKYARSLNPDYKAVFESQLERLKTDYIDFYHIHSVMDKNYEGYIESGCIEYFAEQKAAGRIKNLGFSTHAGVEVFKKFLDLRDWDFVLMQLNPYDWVYGEIKQKYDYLVQKGVPCVAMGPVRGGRLSKLSPEAEKMLKTAQPNWSLTEWTMRWVKNFDNCKVALSGMSTIEQVKENVRVFSDDMGLTDSEVKIYYEALEMFKKEMQAPCTDCKYCIDNDTCPKSINIPRFIDVYNAYKVDGQGQLRKLADVETTGRPADCIACGKCSGVCPQNIDIVPIIQELAKHQA